jgi:hypothetical protein
VPTIGKIRIREDKEKRQMTNPYGMGMERAWQTSSTMLVPNMLVHCIIDIPILICTKLTSKGPRPFFGPFLKFGQAIMDAIFVQKISNFW